MTTHLFLTHLTLSAGLISAAVGQTYLSPCDIDRTPGNQLLITAHTGKQVLRFDPATRTIEHAASLPGEPTDLLQSADGTTWYITGGGHVGRVWKLENGEIIGEIKTGHTPMAPLLSPDEKMLYVCN